MDFTMKLTPALIAALSLTLTGCMSDYGLSYDCSSEGRQKPVSFDNKAGVTWQAPNTARWCEPRGGMSVGDDPTFVPKH